MFKLNCKSPQELCKNDVPVEGLKLFIRMVAMMLEPEKEAQKFTQVHLKHQLVGP
jgi:hypothetical protein